MNPLLGYTIFTENISVIIRIITSILFIALLAQLSINIGPIPITGQTFAVLAVALLTSPKETFISLFLYLMLGAIGFPIFASGASGLAKLTGGSGGFLVGFLIAGTIVSYFYGKSKSKSFTIIMGLTFLGTCLILLFGVLWLSYLHGPAKGLEYGFYPFWKGAIIKVILGSGFVWMVELIRRERVHI